MFYSKFNKIDSPLSQVVHILFDENLYFIWYPKSTRFETKKLIPNNIWNVENFFPCFAPLNHATFLFLFNLYTFSLLGKDSLLMGSTRLFWDKTIAHILPNKIYTTFICTHTYFFEKIQSDNLSNMHRLCSLLFLNRMKP